MNKGKIQYVCRACSSEIVQGVNDGVFNEGDCEGCEYHRYTTQPPLLRAAKELLREWNETELSAAGRRLARAVERCQR